MSHTYAHMYVHTHYHLSQGEKFKAEKHSWELKARVFQHQKEKEAGRETGEEEDQGMVMPSI